MDREDVGWIIAISTIFILIICILFVSLNFALNKPQCYAQTADMGLSARWSFWGGCQVLVSDDVWVPLYNYRYVER